MQNAFLERLKGCSSVMLVGAGGGYDLFCGLPLYHYLRKQGQQVHLASLNFARPGPDWGWELEPGLVEIQVPSVVPPKIGAETCLALWFASRGEQVPIYCFGADGVQPLLGHYRFLQRHCQADAWVLIDGGTDSLLRGDEPGLGSPGEDLASLAAAHLLDVPTKLLACLGFGLDAHHHVCHAYVLEAAADLTASGDFLGAFSLLPGAPEFEFLADAVEFSRECKEARLSIIASSVVAAARGHFGDHHASSRTQGSKLLLNPLMSMYWCFGIEGLARRCGYLEPLLSTTSRGEVTRVIQQYRATITQRPWLNLPF
jgi:hypothetical protein